MNHSDFEVVKYKFTLKVCLLQLLISWTNRQIFTLKKSQKFTHLELYGSFIINIIKAVFFKQLNS